MNFNTINMSCVLIDENTNENLSYLTFKSLLESVNFAKENNINTEIIIISSSKTNTLTKNLPKELTKEIIFLTIDSKNINDYKKLALTKANSELIAFVYSNDLISKSWIYEAYKHINEQTEIKSIYFPENFIVFLDNKDPIEYLLNHQTTNNDNTFKNTPFTYYNYKKMPCIFQKSFIPKNYNEYTFSTIPKTLCFIRNQNIQNSNAKKTFTIKRSYNNALIDFLHTNKHKKIAFYGAGIKAESFISAVDLSDYNIVGFIDKNKAGMKIKNYKIYALDDIETLNPDILIFTLQNWELLYFQIANTLQAKNLKTLLIPNLLEVIIEDKEKTEINFKTEIQNNVLEEINNINKIDPSLFIEKSKYKTIKTNTLSIDNLFNEYSTILKYNNKNIDYLFLVPWLTLGGADLEALNYIQAIANLHKDKNIVVLATANKKSLWKDKLPKEVTFIEFGKNFSRLSTEIKELLLFQYVLNMNPKVIHNINSALGYKLFIQYGDELSKKSKLFVNTFCPDYSEEGKLENWTLKYLPHCFKYLTNVFVDNQAFIDMLVNLFNFDKSKFKVHYHPINIPRKNTYINKIPEKNALDIFWAGRLDRQKRPDLLIKIAKKSKDLPFKFHVHGSNVMDNKEYTQQLQELDNVNYYGGYDNFYSINKTNYDVFLFTSQWEGLPNILLEAISCGIPVISAKVGGVAELIKQNKTGFIINPFDNVDNFIAQLVEIYNNSSCLEHIVNNAYTAIEQKHSWEHFEKLIINSKDYSCID